MVQGGRVILEWRLRPGSQKAQDVLGCKEPPDLGGCCMTLDGPLPLFGPQCPHLYNDCGGWELYSLVSEALSALPGCMVEKGPCPHPASPAHPPWSSGWGQAGSAERVTQMQAQQLDGPR